MDDTPINSHRETVWLRLHEWKMDEKGKDLIRMKRELELVFQDGEKTVTVEVKVSFLVQDNEEDECRTPIKKG